MLIKRFQVWMMAEALRRRAAGEQAAADEIRTALSRVIVANREFDEPLAAAIAGREKALNQAFEQGSSGGEAPTIIDLAGGTPLEQLGFWVVIASAKEAWLDRLAETEEQDTSLREAISRKVGQMDQFLEAIQLTKELQVPPIPTLLQAMSTDSVSQEDIDDDLIFRTGSIIGCLECLRYQSYSALATRLVAFRDIISTGGLRPLDVGAPLDVEPEISRASADGSLSSLIKYEIEQAKIDTRDQTVKLVCARSALVHARGAAGGRACAARLRSPAASADSRFPPAMRPLPRVRRAGRAAGHLARSRMSGSCCARVRPQGVAVVAGGPIRPRCP